MNKEIKITPPEGYEIDRENSTFECVKFKPKILTYEDVVKALFNNKNSYYLDVYATSKKQTEKLIAINKLMNVAKYLNGDWKPNWSNEYEPKWYSHDVQGSIEIQYCREYCCAITYFKTKELAQQAIEILGEDTIRLALSTDW